MWTVRRITALVFRSYHINTTNNIISRIIITIQMWRNRTKSRNWNTNRNCFKQLSDKDDLWRELHDEVGLILYYIILDTLNEWTVKGTIGWLWFDRWKSRLYMIAFIQESITSIYKPQHTSSSTTSNGYD